MKVRRGSETDVNSSTAIEPSENGRLPTLPHDKTQGRDRFDWSPTYTFSSTHRANRFKMYANIGLQRLFAKLGGHLEPLAATQAGGARSQRTRERILAAARQQFASLGFDRCTVRSVASEASIHPSLVMRYFGSKEGLFASAMSFDLQLPPLLEVPEHERGYVLVTHLLKRWRGPESSSELPALVRLAIAHPEAKKRLFEIFNEQLVPVIRLVVPPRQAKVITALIATQTMGLALARYILEIPAVVALPEKTLIEAIGGTIQGYLQRDV